MRTLLGPDRIDDLLSADHQLGLEPLRDPGVVTLAGDWHSEYAFVERVAAGSPAGATGVRTIVQLGDLGVWSHAEGAAYLDDLARLLERIDAVLMFIDGNHEDHPFLLSHPCRPDGLRVLRPRIYHIPRGFRWRWHGKTWLALGGAYSIARPRLTPGVNWWPEESITSEDALHAVDGGPAEIMITHDCPAGVTPPGIRDPAPGQPKELYDELVLEAEHRRLLRHVVDEVRPSRIVHGHYHVRYDAQLSLSDGTACSIIGLGRTGTLDNNVLVLDLTESWQG